MNHLNDNKLPIHAETRHRLEMRMDIQLILDNWVKNDLYDETEDIVVAIMDRLPERTFLPVNSDDLGNAYLYGDITTESALKFIEKLDDIDANLPKDASITVYINSSGGSIVSGFSIYNKIMEIRRRGRRVLTHVQGEAASMASVILQAGEVRSMDEFSSLLIHSASSDFGWDKTYTLRVSLNSLELMQHQMYRVYAKRTGKSTEYFKDLLKHEDVYLGSSAALITNLIDRVIPTI